jgi:hypothetical protein
MVFSMNIAKEYYIESGGICFYRCDAPQPDMGDSAEGRRLLMDFSPHPSG